MNKPKDMQRSSLTFQRLVAESALKLAGEVQNRKVKKDSQTGAECAWKRNDFYYEKTMISLAIDANIEASKKSGKVNPKQLNKAIQKVIEDISTKEKEAAL